MQTKEVHHEGTVGPVRFQLADCRRRAGVAGSAPGWRGTALKRGEVYFVSLDPILGYALCNQLRALDLRARGGKRVEKLPTGVVAEVLARLAAFFDLD